MGCCCCKSGDEDGIQLYNRSGSSGSKSKYKGMGSDPLSSDDDQNDSVMCKCGPHADGIVITKELETNTWKLEAVSGGGTALGTCPLDCDTAVWQVRLGKNPAGIRVGVKRYNPKHPCDLNGSLVTSDSDKENPSWSMGPDTTGVVFAEGDVVDMYWDQTDLPMLSFSINGDARPSADVNRVRPANDVRPAVSLEKGSSCEIIFDGRHFTHPPKSSKFKNIICSTSLI